MRVRAPEDVELEARLGAADLSDDEKLAKVLKLYKANVYVCMSAHL